MSSQDYVTVRYTGPRFAILAGQAIWSGSTRKVTRSALVQAERFHPDQFVVVGEDVQTVSRADAPQQSGFTAPQRSQETDQPPTLTFTNLDGTTAEITPVMAWGLTGDAYTDEVTHDNQPGDAGKPPAKRRPRKE